MPQTRGNDIVRKRAARKALSLGVGYLGAVLLAQVLNFYPFNAVTPFVRVLFFGAGVIYIVRGLWLVIRQPRGSPGKGSDLPK